MVHDHSEKFKKNNIMKFDFPEVIKNANLMNMYDIYYAILMYMILN